MKELIKQTNAVYSKIFNVLMILVCISAIYSTYTYPLINTKTVFINLIKLILMCSIFYMVILNIINYISSKNILIIKNFILGFIISLQVVLSIVLIVLNAEVKLYYIFILCIWQTKIFFTIIDFGFSCFDTIK